MLYGVLDYSTSGSTLTDPYVLTIQQEQAAADAAAKAAAQRSAQPPQVASGGWAYVLAAIGVGLVWWHGKRKKSSLSSAGELI